MMKLRVKNLSFSFENKKVLENINFEVKEGEFISLIGPSGCGKSTILNILAGLLKTKQGEIYVDDEKIEGLSSHFAYMPQNDLLFEWNNIIDNVLLYNRIKGDAKNRKAEALAKVKEFGLAGYEYAYPKELSGGMRQRAAFLRTSMCDADIELLDEPFGALDVITRNDMQDWLNDMRTKLNKTSILVTHDIDEAIYLSDRIMILSNNPSSIVEEIDLSKFNKTRTWLYNQSELRNHIYEILKGANHD